MRSSTIAVGPNRSTPARRPPGGPEPLDRPIYTSGRVYVAMTILLVVGWLLALEIPSMSAWFQRLDEATVDWISRERSADVAQEVAEVVGPASAWVWRIVRWTTLVVLLATRRFRHLVVYVILVLSVTALLNVVADVAERPPPMQAWTLTSSAASAHPARAVVDLSLSMVGALYTLLPRGPVRNRGKLVAAALVTALVSARLYLALEYPTDLAAALVLGAAVPVVLFRYATPHSAFPITYAGGKPRGLTADVIRRIELQLLRQKGFRVERLLALRPPGSAGSTPLRLDVSSHDDGILALFGKLYTQDHLRADRWYKLGRAVLYGRLEDEAPFADIRHLVEHEDYMLRVAAEAGLAVPRTFGVVEVVPGREYLLLLEWLPDGLQLSSASVDGDDALSSQAISMMAHLRRMGIAHRDIKPANLVVSDGRLYLVDLSFAELHGSQWRRDADLGAMLMSLALFASPSDVLDTARRWFSDDELAAALAAAHDVTVPAQLRAMLKRADPPPDEALRSALPARRPVKVQRWSIERVLLSAAVAVCAVTFVALVVFNIQRAGIL